MAGAIVQYWGPSVRSACRSSHRTIYRKTATSILIAVHKEAANGIFAVGTICLITRANVYIIQDHLIMFWV